MSARKKESICNQTEAQEQKRGEQIGRETEKRDKLWIVSLHLGICGLTSIVAISYFWKEVCFMSSNPYPTVMLLNR
jgi:hypothetical protein